MMGGGLEEPEEHCPPPSPQGKIPKYVWEKGEYIHRTMVSRGKGPSGIRSQWCQMG